MAGSRVSPVQLIEGEGRPRSPQPFTSCHARARGAAAGALLEPGTLTHLSVARRPASWCQHGKNARKMYLLRLRGGADERTHHLEAVPPIYSPNNGELSDPSRRRIP